MERVITLHNRNGLTARFTNYGARWLAMLVPDRQGNLEDVLLGFDDLVSYKKAREQYYGATVGRVCGRIRQHPIICMVVLKDFIVAVGILQ